MVKNKKEPEKKQKRKITGADMLAELDFPAYSHIPFIKCSYDYYSKGFEKLVDFYIKLASGSAKGEAGFAVRFLLARCVNDLATGFHLATHGYVIQAHSVLRSIFESLDKIELFSSNKEYAKIWVNNQKKSRNKLSPSGVRKLLKKDKEDIYTKMYGFFCELGPHPTFSSSKTMSYVKESSGGKKQIIVKIGPTDLVHPILFILVFCFLLMMSVSLSITKHLEAKENEERELLFFQFRIMNDFFENCAKPAFIKYDGKLLHEFQKILADLEKQKEYLESEHQASL